MTGKMALRVLPCHGCLHLRGDDDLWATYRLGLLASNQQSLQRTPLLHSDPPTAALTTPCNALHVQLETSWR